MIRTLPLALRDRLSETILGALHDATARHALRALATPEAATRWLGEAETRWADLTAERARRAHEAIAARPLRPAAPDLATALGDAAALFDAGLYFEVHEVLEPRWAESEGETREALQGLIQAAVGYQHLANGNLAGARSLLLEAAHRLHGGHLLGRDLDGFARAAAVAAERVMADQPVDVPPFPV